MFLIEFPVIFIDYVDIGVIVKLKYSIQIYKNQEENRSTKIVLRLNSFV